MAAPRNVYLVNYFPAVNGGYTMWSSYNGAQYQADMTVIKNLGFNTIRVILPAKTGCFDFNTPTAPELANLVDFYNRAKTVGLSLHLTGFDSWNSYGYITSSETWLGTILNALPDFTNIQCVELQNEQKFGAVTTTYGGGYGGGWTAATTGLNDGQIETEWARKMILWLRANYPTLAVTVSAASGGRNISDVKTFLQSVYTSFNGTAAAPDWYEWHSYVPGGMEYSYIQSIIYGLGGNVNQLFIGEYGAVTEAKPDGTRSATQLLQEQADAMKAVRSACQILGVPEPSPWIIYDMLPCPQFPTGQLCGLYDSSGNIKPSGRLYAVTPPGSANIPAPDLNSNMRGLQYPYGSFLPLRWYTLPGSDGSQTITGALDPTNLYQGEAMVLLTNSSSSSSQPSFCTEVGALWPQVSAGQSYTFSIALKGTGSNGSPRVNISWYSATAYISGTNGSVLTLTSTTTRYSVTSTAPTGALYARLSVVTNNNAGNIWTGGASWSGVAPRLAVSNGQWYRK